MKKRTRTEVGRRTGGRRPRSAPRLAVGVAMTLLAAIGVAGCDTPMRSVELRMTHRMYPRFHDERSVAPGERFQIGDTDLSGRIVDFVPDFGIDDRTGKVVARSDSLRNPAFRIEVYQADSLIEKTWAFMKGSPPHFSGRSMLNFEVQRIIWKPGQGPADSTAAPDSVRTGS
jgi:hypothetical protein